MKRDAISECDDQMLPPVPNKMPNRSTAVFPISRVVR
jgi:hypothetical protein